MRQWNETVRLHDNAVAAFANSASRARAWTEQPAAKKWSPAQITEHLNLAFNAILNEARGGPSMAPRTKRWQQFVLRYTIYRRLVNGGKFPNGARAPRETRPQSHTDAVPENVGAAAIADFRRLAAETGETLTALRASNPAFRFMHPYFGPVSVDDALYISARHIENHRAQIAVRKDGDDARGT